MLFTLAIALLSGATALYVKNGRLGFKSKKKSASQVTNVEAFRHFCKNAVASPQLFAHFKSDPIYTLFYENASEEEGRVHLSLIGQRTPELLSPAILEKVSLNDTLGSPKTYHFEGAGTFSPTTLRYLKVASDLKRSFQSLDGMKIIEIGGGYGGQCKILFDLFDIASYTIIDLPEGLELTKKYLQALGVTSRVHFLKPTQVESQECDLLISNYGFTESSAALQSHYFDALLRRAPRGYMTCNFFYKHFRVRPWTKEGLLKKLSSLPIKMHVLPEEPQIGEENFVVIWSPATAEVL